MDEPTVCWMWGDPAAPSFPEEAYDVAKSALFQDPPQPQPGENVEFQLLELHVVSSDNDVTSQEDGSQEQIEYQCRVFTHTGTLLDMQDETCGTKECRYTRSSEEALILYAKIYSRFTKLHKTKKFLSRWIGSPVYRKQAMETGLTDGPAISDEVTRLVEYLWREAMGELREILSVPYRKIGTGKVEKAEGILLQVRKILDMEPSDTEQLNKLTGEFYKLIPHKDHHVVFLDNKRVLAGKQELCQLIHDIVTVSEATDWSQRSSSQSRYRALQCYLDCLAPDHPEFIKVESLVQSTISSDDPLEIKRIFAASRGVEEAVYAHDIGNDRLLFHASRPSNFLGILSRGVLLPKIVVEVFGGARRDAGMLGSGIYFGDRVSTAQQYSSPSQQTGTRLMVVNKVALGNIRDLYKFDLSLDEAPDGYHSVHGISRTTTTKSDFKDDEFVVYEANQQCIRYLVEFTLPGDSEIEMPLCETPQVEEGVEELILCEQVQLESSAPPTDIDLSDIECAKDPVANIQAGLINANETSDTVTLQAVHIRAKVLDLVAQVVVLQAYRNNSDESTEAKYVFPVDEGAAVCGFEAFINNKHVVGVVKEKEQAHQEYREAMEKGHGAYLMDEEAPNVFSVTVGNLPAHADVLIKVIYVTELAVEGDKLAFNLLGTVAPWKRQEVMAKGAPGGGDVIDVELETIYKKESIQVSVTMANKITCVESPTHSILVKRDNDKASIQLRKDSTLDDGFQLLIGLEEMHKPRMWLEEHPGEEDQAAMLVFYPDFEVDTLANPDMVLVLDSSNSMKGELLEEAKKLLLLILQNLPANCTFNVIFFGTEFDELFPASQQKTRSNLKAAREFIKSATAEQGCTDFWRPLQSNNLLKSKRALRNLFLITDGHLSNEEATLRAVGRHRATSRVFTFGVSKSANRHLLAAVARHGGGAFEFFDTKAKSTWERKIKLQVCRASQPAVTSLSVSWEQTGSEHGSVLQAPTEITSLFRHNRLLVYGLIRNCQGATLSAEINSNKVQTRLSASDHPKLTGKILHQLAARAIIRNWQEGALSANRIEHEAHRNELKSRIVKLSMQYSIVTPLTSFVAVEERDEEEQRYLAEGQSPTLSQSLDKLLEAEDVDHLIFQDWEDPTEATKQFSPLNRVHNLLKTARVAADSYSFKSAEMYFEKAYDLAKETLTYTEPLTLQVAHSFSKFCARVTHNMELAFELINGAFQETKKAMPDLPEDTSQLEDLDVLQQAVEWAEMCEIEMKRSQAETKTKDTATYKPRTDDEELDEVYHEASEGGPDILLSSKEIGTVVISHDIEGAEVEPDEPLELSEMSSREAPHATYHRVLVTQKEEVLVEDLREKKVYVPEPILRLAMSVPEPIEYLQELEVDIEPMRMIERDILMPEPKLMIAAKQIYHHVEVKEICYKPAEKIERRVLLPEPVHEIVASVAGPVDVPEYEDRMAVIELPRALPDEDILQPTAQRDDRYEDPAVESCYDPTIEDCYEDPAMMDEGIKQKVRMPEPDSVARSLPKHPTKDVLLASNLDSLQLGGTTEVRKESSRLGKVKAFFGRGKTATVSKPAMETTVSQKKLSKYKKKHAVARDAAIMSNVSPTPPLPGFAPLAASHAPQRPPTLEMFKDSKKSRKDISFDDELVTDALSPVEDPKTFHSILRLIGLQHKDGYWEFQPTLLDLLGIEDLEFIEHVRGKVEFVMSQKGAKADLSDSFDLILRLVATLIARLHIRMLLSQEFYHMGVEYQVDQAFEHSDAFLQVAIKQAKQAVDVRIDWKDIARELLSECKR